jgi:hypothetical protein
MGPPKAFPHTGSPINSMTAGTSVSGAQSQTKPAVLWRGSVDYDLSRHFALRL